MERKFYKDTAEAMIRWKDAQGTTVPHAEALVIQDDGVVVEESYRDESPQDHVFDWTPVDDMDWHGAPNPLKARALPIPFTAAELAAFMLDGAGYGLQEYLDRRIGYPLDDEALECFGGNRYRVVREALQSAYALAEQAQSVVGEYDYEEEKRAVDMRKQFENENGRANTREGVFEPGISADEQRERRKRAVESVADLKEQVLQAEDQTRNKWAAWRKAMVKELLQPSPTVSEVAADAPTQSTQAAHVAATSDGPRKRRAKKPTVEAVALAYMRKVYKAGQFESAAKFHKHLTQTAGTTGSPFAMGTGSNARKLFCPAASSFYEAGTLGKIWSKIRAP